MYRSSDSPSSLCRSSLTAPQQPVTSPPGATGQAAPEGPMRSSQPTHGTSTATDAHDNHSHHQDHHPTMMQKLTGRAQVSIGKMMHKPEMVAKGEAKLHGDATTGSTTTAGQQHGHGTNGHEMTRVSSIPAQPQS
ncbi:hypothetical protein ACM66B_002222 [Microbotryomycetes sp. NB124-2]